MAWDVSSITSAYILAFALVFAPIILLISPERVVNRLLALIALFEAILAAGFYLMPVIPEYSVARAASLMGAGALNALPFLYLALLGHTLRTPLVAPFRSTAARWVLYGAATLGFLAVLVWPHHFAGPTLPRGSGWWAGQSIGNDIGAIILSATYFYSLFASVSAFRRALPGTPARRQAKYFLIAYSVRDALMGSAILSGYGAAFGWWDALFPTRYALVVIAVIFPPLFIYAILQGQLFDLDLKIKWSVSRGTLALCFVAMFFIASKLAEGIADRFLGGKSWVIGAIAGGLLLFAIAPLQRWAERVADRAMPNTTGSDEYVRFKKFEVYRATFESLALDGAVTRGDRYTLAKLRRRLGISDGVAAQLEGEVGGRTTSSARRHDATNS